MKQKQNLYNKVFKIIKDYTPLTVDCGVLCNHACCKGDENTGMLLFPFEETSLDVKITEDGNRLAVCNGSCDRNIRPYWRVEFSLSFLLLMTEGKYT